MSKFKFIYIYGTGRLQWIWIKQIPVTEVVSHRGTESSLWNWDTIIITTLVNLEMSTWVRYLSHVLQAISCRAKILSWLMVNLFCHSQVGGQSFLGGRILLVTTFVSECLLMEVSMVKSMNGKGYVSCQEKGWWVFWMWDSCMSSIQIVNSVMPSWTGEQGNHDK
jgi:hypothetical protein